MTRVFTVLNVGGGFLPKHAQALQKQVLQWSPPGTEFICLTNQEVPGVQTMPLKLYGVAGLLGEDGIVRSGNRRRFFVHGFRHYGYRTD